MNMKLFFIVLSVFLVCSCGGGKGNKVDQSRLLEDQKGLAMASIKRGNFQQGIKDIEAAEKIDPDDSEIYLIKGILYFGLKDNSLAEKNYKKALSLDPKLTVANYNLCGFYLKVNKYDDAITYCEKALSVMNTFQIKVSKNKPQRPRVNLLFKNKCILIPLD